MLRLLRMSATGFIKLSVTSFVDSKINLVRRRVFLASKVGFVV